MKKLILLFFIPVLGIGSAFADDPGHVVKLNLYPLAFQNFSLQYEKPFHDRMSVALGVSFMPSRSLPFSDLLPDEIRDLRFGGFNITPEFRFYLGSNGAPRGFYFAPYLRYANYSISMPTNILSEALNRPAMNEEFFGRMSGIGGGLMIGSQWLIGGRFSLDWWIMGGHVGVATYSLDVRGIANLTQSEQQTTRDRLDEYVDNIEVPGMGFSNITTNVDTNSAGISFKSAFSGIRSGLTIGWAF
jgi:hypothetical protein